VAAAVAHDSPHIHSIQVGVPQQHGQAGAADPMDKLWTTGFYKQPVEGAVYASRRNLEGDGQADLENHGGPDKAICCYPLAHYAAWAERLGVAELPTGAFGENFTIAGLTEPNVCVGDTYAVGERLVVQLSQPRQPCWKLARRWRVKTLALEVQQTGRTGWYFRVLTPGRVAAGADLRLVERPFPAWTIARANQIMYAKAPPRDEVLALSEVPLLSESWRTHLARAAASYG
jgi:MOSC domain-containing protein YiiM